MKAHNESQIDTNQSTTAIEMKNERQRQIVNFPQSIQDEVNEKLKTT